MSWNQLFRWVCNVDEGKVFAYRTQHNTEAHTPRLTLRKCGDSLGHRLRATNTWNKNVWTQQVLLGLWVSCWDFRCLLIFDCDYCRLTKMDAVKQKVAILSPRAVRPAVTANISWPWKPWGVRIVMMVGWNLSSVLWDSGSLLVLITKRIKW